MMAQYNREELLRSLHQYRQALDQFTAFIEQNRWEDLEQALTQTQEARTEFVR
jgi:arogenate dehydrogenase (NADP+)